MTTHPSQKQLVAWVLEEVSEKARAELSGHIADCQRCTNAVAKAQSELGSLARADPPSHAPARRAERIRHAITTGKQHPTRRLQWWLVPAAAAIASVALLVWAPWQSAPRLTPRLSEGILHQSGRALATNGDVVPNQQLSVPAGQRAVIRLNEGGKIVAAASTNFVSVHGDGSHWQLSSGTLSLDLPPRTEKKKKNKTPFVVKTSEVEVSVVGTRFSVERMEQTTSVRVTRGLVRVVPSSGEPTEIGAGGAATFPPAEPAESTDETDDTEAQQQSKQPVRPAPKVATIRARLESGQLGEARALIRRARKSDHPYGAELSIVEAETNLAEGRFAAAIQLYLQVSKKLRHTREAETALFAAAQLASDHPQAGHDASELLERYLARYPHGRFVTEARLLLAALEQ